SFSINCELHATVSTTARKVLYFLLTNSTQFINAFYCTNALASFAVVEKNQNYYQNGEHSVPQ
ncbi:MAG: hypothetical protein AAF378_16930, partial [Cyanobacteria bacterium P01_A01_bin.84]